MGQTINLVSQFGAPTFTSLRVIGNTTLGNNLVVSGSITAQSLIVNSTSVYSGSTKFGEIITNTHQFTGSLLISGSTTVVGQYNGSGAGLTGTAASLSIGGNAATATTAGTITSQANSATITAASTNTANQIVLRDGSGNFSAGTITATLTGNASTATTSTNLYGVGGSYIASSNGGQGYNLSIQIREAGLAGAQGSSMVYAPRLAFHWSGVVASSIAVEANGRIGIFNNPGTSYENFVANIIYANSSFQGNLTGNVTGNLTGNVTGNCSGTSNNITAYTINQNVGSSNSPTFTGLTVNGSITATGDIIAYYTSDKRYKNNIQPITNALLKVSKLNGVTWEWNDNVNEVIKQSPKTGLIAQEVEEILPEVVKTRDDGFLALDYSKMMGLMVEAIKEQQSQIEELKSRL
jgi:hypothetical protein